MSGYRNLHREQILDDEVPIWEVSALSVTHSSDEWNVLTASADGVARIFRVQEKELSAELDASALGITCSHALLGVNQVYPPTQHSLVGCSSCQIIRNYVGDDDMAGDLVVVSLDFTGRMRIWNLSDMEFTGNEDKTTKQIRPDQETIVENATGTLMAVCPPNLFGHGDLMTAVACLDGSIALVALGIATPKAKQDAIAAGTVVDCWGSGAVALSMCWHPTQSTVAIGRKDGLVEIIPSKKKGHHRLTRHSQPVRAVCFTPDGQILVSGSDDGFLAVWDISRSVPTMVHHIMSAHASWILGITALGDSRRFVTCGAERKVHVWELDHMHSPSHTFQCDQTLWTLCATLRRQPQRLVGCSEKGWLQVFSLAG